MLLKRNEENNRDRFFYGRVYYLFNIRQCKHNFLITQLRLLVSICILKKY